MKTILIIEKETDFRALYMEGFKEDAYRIILVKCDEEALKIVEENVPDLIISDYQTPPTTSYLTMLLKANQITSVPLIIHTSYTFDLMDFTLALYATKVEYLEKSSDLNRLKNKMREMLD